MTSGISLVILIDILYFTFVRPLQSNSALGAFYRRLRSRLGTPKAVTATAHKIARIFDRLWTSGGDDQDLGLDYYEQRYRERIVNNLHKKARSLGDQLVPRPASDRISGSSGLVMQMALRYLVGFDRKA